MAKPKKKSRRKFITKMMICSREWELWEDPKRGGASFSHGDPMNRRRRTIVLGTIDDDPRYTAEMLIHEIVEIILSTDEKRYHPNWQQAGDQKDFVVCDRRPNPRELRATAIRALSENHSR